jgi:hypothetical protein
VPPSRHSTSQMNSSHTLHTYRLKFMDDSRGLAKDIEFEASDAAHALIIAHKEASNRSAELWRDGKKVCTIRRIGEDIWEIGGVERLAQAHQLRDDD